MIYRAPRCRIKLPAPPSVCPATAGRRQGAHLSRKPSKEAVAIQGGMIGAGSAGVPVAPRARSGTSTPGLIPGAGRRKGDRTTATLWRDAMQRKDVEVL